jgi:hypothetical protein
VYGGFPSGAITTLEFVPRPTGKGERELNERVQALVARTPRRHSSEVVVRHVAPAPRAVPEPEDPYPGWIATPKQCRREGCGKTFMPKAPSQAYCGKFCLDEATRAGRRRTDKAWRAKRAAQRGPLQRTCALPGCNNIFHPPAARSAYCCAEHRAEATRRIKHRSSNGNGNGKPTSATAAAVIQIEAADRAMNGQPVPAMAREYIASLWKRVNEDPNCPEHCFDRLERLLGLTPSTILIDADHANC